MTDASMTPEELCVKYGRTKTEIFDRPRPEDDAQQALRVFEQVLAAPPAFKPPKSDHGLRRLDAISEAVAASKRLDRFR